MPNNQIKKRKAFRVGHTYSGPRGRKIQFSKGDVFALQERLTQMSSDGYVIPVIAQHQNAGKPMKKNDPRLKKAFGTLDEISMDENGNVDFVVSPFQHAIQMGKAWPNKTSVEIVSGWKDGKNSVWDGPSVTHLALTNRPVAKEQPEEWVRMGLASSIEEEDGQEILRMGMDGKWGEEDFGEALDEAGDLWMADDDYDDEDEESDELEDDELEDDEFDYDDGEEEDMDYSDEDDGAGDMTDELAGPEELTAATPIEVAGVMKMLEDNYGLRIMPASDPATLVTNLYQALYVTANQKSNEDAGDGSEDDFDNFGEDPLVEEEKNSGTGGVLMGFGKKRKSDGDSKILKLAKRDRRRSYASRFNALAEAGVITSAENKNFQGLTTTVRMSLDDDGEWTPNELDRILVFLEDRQGSELQMSHDVGTPTDWNIHSHGFEESPEESPKEFVTSMKEKFNWGGN